MKYYLLFISTFLIHFLFGQPQSSIPVEKLFILNEKDSIERMMIEESQHLDSLIFFTRIWMSTGPPTQFDPYYGVIINKKQLIDLTQKNNIKDIRNLIRLCIAHEKAHARQYMMLQNVGRTFASLTPEERQINEIQADMCAGYCFLYPYLNQYSEVLLRSILYNYRSSTTTGSQTPIPSFSVEDSSMIFTLLERNKESIRLFFSIGENEGAYGGHPNSIYREEAFQMGVSAVQADAMNLIKRKSVNITPQEWQFINGQTYYLMLVLGIFPNDFDAFGYYFQSWSYRTASQLIHYSNRTCNRVLFRVNDSHWNTSVANPFFYFDLDVVNNNADSVIVNMVIAIKWVPRNNPHDALKSQLTSASRSVFVLAPGQTHHIIDSVMWIPGNDSKIPSVFFPGEEGSIYSIIPIRNNSGAITAQSTNKESAKLGESQHIAMNLALKYIKRDIIEYGVDELVDGSGLIWDSSNEIVYNAYRWGQHLKVHNPVQGGNTYYTINLLKSASLGEAEKVFGLMYQVMTSLTDETYSEAEIKSPGSGILKRAITIGSESKQGLTLSLSKLGRYYVVEITIKKT